MKALAAGAMLMTAACTAVAPPAGAEEILPRGTGKACDAAKAQGLVGGAGTQALAAEAIRLSGAGALRWVRPGMMVTMDYREDRLNLHVDPTGKVVKIACG